MAKTRVEMLKLHEENAPAELVASMESFCNSLQDLVDVRRNPTTLFESDYVNVVTPIALEGIQEYAQNMSYEGDTVCMEGVSEEDPDQTRVMSVAESHMYNMQALMENSAKEYRISNERNMNEITPFDGFLPFIIIRSYLPLVGIHIMPYVVPKVPFIRIKEKYKYIVTKNNQSYLRPDVYNDPVASSEILQAAKGRNVTDAWFPEGVEVGDASDDGTVTAVGNYIYNGKEYKPPTDKLAVTVDVLAESGGLLEIGDALDIDVRVEGAKAIVQNAEGTDVVIEADHIQAYPDVTSYSPQRSINATIKYAIKDANGQVESIVEDRIYGSFNSRTSTFEVVSATGITKQIRFAGHLSNKNNSEYISYRNEYKSFDHPIPEGFNMNVPLTLEDEQLYRETASISIIADAINEMTEIFTNIEDMELYNKIKTERARWTGVGKNEHPFEHFHNGPVALADITSVAYTNGQLLKRNQYVQDAIQYALNRLIGDARTTCGNEQFKVIAFCHPNIASLFVGENCDWKIEPGTAIAEGIRSDYNMGIYTADGNKIRLVASQKFEESEGLQGIILPVNETNFLSWKHFKYNMIFSKDYHVYEMPNNPNVRGMSRFNTQSYVPLTIQLLIEDYK